MLFLVNFCRHPQGGKLPDEKAGFDLLMLLFGAKAHFLNDLCKRLVGVGATAFYPASGSINELNNSAPCHCCGAVAYCPYPPL